MGSTLTIVNNTTDTWSCKVGPDEQALKMVGVIIGAIGAISTLIATAGAAGVAIPVIASSSGVLVTGVATSSLVNVSAILAGFATTATVIQNISEFVLYVANSISDQLKKKNFEQIISGTSHRFGPMPLTMWQQSQCTRTVILDEKRVRVDTLYMRPIFSGSSPGSNLDHDIQYWLDVNDVSSQTVEAQSSPV